MSTQRWDIDSERSRINFAVRHFVLSKTRGRFNRWSGTVMVPDGDFSRATVDVVIDAASIDTGVPLRDAHLRSADDLVFNDAVDNCHRAAHCVRTGDELFDQQMDDL